jgi:ESX secretion system protein EccE
MSSPTPDSGYGDLAAMVARQRTAEPEPHVAEPAAAAESSYLREPAADTRTLHRTGARRVAAAEPAAAPMPASTSTAMSTSSGATSSLGVTATAGQARGLTASSALFPPPDRGTPDARSGTVYGRSRHAVDLYDTGDRRIDRLHLGWHSASLVTLSMMSTGAPAAGLILGEDVDHHAVAIRMFRPEPTLVTLIGGVWAAQVIGFRALAVGAGVVVLTDDPASWRDFAGRAGSRVTVATQAQQSADSIGPTLVIRDFAHAATTPPAHDLRTWEAQLTVLRRLDEHGVGPIQDSHVVLAQRLYLDEAMIAVTSMRLTSDNALLLQQLEPEMVAIVGVGTSQYLWWAPTGSETRLLGPARR